MKPELYIIMYRHKHGEDIMIVAGTSEGDALVIAREQLVEMYGEKEIAYEEENYGCLETYNKFRSGDTFEYKDSQYRIWLELVGKKGQEWNS